MPSNRLLKVARPAPEATRVAVSAANLISATGAPAGGGAGLGLALVGANGARTGGGGGAWYAVEPIAAGIGTDAGGDSMFGAGGGAFAATGAGAG